MNATENEPSFVECGKHGRQKSAIVCRHHLRTTDRAVGFVENSSDPDDLQGWCDQCERQFEQEGGMTPAFRKFNDMTVVCVTCYADLKQKHSKH